MDHQSAWIDRLFSRLLAMYGRTFADLWADIPASDVKAEWRAGLAPYSAQQIGWALDACKREFDLAPTLPRFLKLCAQAPRPTPTALPAPELSGKDRDRRIVDLQCLSLVTKKNPNRNWIGRLKRRRDFGENLLFCQSWALECVEGLEDVEDEPPAA